MYVTAHTISFVSFVHERLLICACIACFYLMTDGVVLWGSPDGAANLRTLEYDVYQTAVGPSGTNSRIIFPIAITARVLSSFCIQMCTLSI
jgi:hypothetical protein